MAKKIEMELKVGLFVTVGVALVAVAIVVLGSTESLLSRKLHFYAHLPTAEGLIDGAKVVLGGIPVGTVEAIKFDGEHRDISVQFSVDKESSKWVRSDSTLEVMTQGMLGDKFVSLTPGTVEKTEIADGGEVPYRASKDLSQFLSKGDQLLLTLNSIATDLDRILHAFEKDNRSEILFENLAKTSRNFTLLTEKLNKQMEDMPMRSTVKNLNGILEKINNGTGTLGALINDPALYDNVKSLVGGANRNRIIRNLVRKTVESGMEAEGTETAPGGTPKKK
jgi:phospholipid/cholesterol/gamma-HCH transport system substrate-binding protein